MRPYFYYGVFASLSVSVLTSCGPEQSSTVYPREVTGLIHQESWSNENWSIKLPEMWIVEPVFGMRDASFRIIGEAGMEAEVSISKLPLSGGTLESNVNRWRIQAGLEPWEEKDVLSQLKKIEITGHPAYQIKFESAEETFDSIYGIIMEQKEERIFVKFSGPSSLLKEQEAAWDWFVENLEYRNAR